MAVVALAATVLPTPVRRACSLCSHTLHRLPPRLGARSPCSDRGDFIFLLGHLGSPPPFVVIEPSLRPLGTSAGPL